MLKLNRGGKDASELPFFYESFQGSKSYQNGHELRELLITQEKHKATISKLINLSNDSDKNKLRYLYIVGRNYWIVIVNQSGDFVNYLKIE